MGKSNPASDMNLREFIHDTLMDILRGVHDTALGVKREHEEPDPLLGVVNPGLFEFNRTNDIKFDVALVVSKTKGGKIGVRVPALSASGESDRTVQHTSRVKFSVPVAFASQPVSGYKYTSTGPPASAEDYEDYPDDLEGPDVVGQEPDE